LLPQRQKLSLNRPLSPPSLKLWQNLMMASQSRKSAAGGPWDAKLLKAKIFGRRGNLPPFFSL